MKNLLVINQFASLPSNQFGAGERIYHLSKYIKEAGYNIDVVSGSYNHLFKTFPISPKTYNLETTPYAKYIWVKLRRYRKSSFLGRVISWFEFLIKLFFLKLERKPDIVLVSSMSLMPIIYAIWLKYKYNSKFILEIRDIWPLTPIEIGGYSKRNPLIYFLGKVEKIGYKKADTIISVLPGFGKYLSDIGFSNKEFTWIPNGVVVDNDNLKEENPTIEFSLEFFNVVYTGAIGKANALNYFLEAARLLKGNTTIKFHLIGDGPERNTLEKQAIDLPNVEFYGSIPKKDIYSVLRNADLCFIGWHNRKIYKYGVSANKYNDYMISKTPLLSSSNIKEDPVILSNSGFHVEAENPVAIAEAIEKMSKLSTLEKNRMGENGYNFVFEKQTYSKISELYVNVLNKVIY